MKYSNKSDTNNLNAIYFVTGKDLSQYFLSKPKTRKGKLQAKHCDRLTLDENTSINATFDEHDASNETAIKMWLTILLHLITKI